MLNGTTSSAYKTKTGLCHRAWVIKFESHGSSIMRCGRSNDVLNIFFLVLERMCANFVLTPIHVDLFPSRMRT